MDRTPSDVHVPPDEEAVTGGFRVYRNAPAVDHVNLFGGSPERLYSVYRSGNPDDRQATVDDLRTGDFVTATLLGDPDSPDEAWRLARVERDDAASVAMAFGAGVDPDTLPAVADNPDLRERAATEPVGRVLERDGRPVSEVWLQPRDPLPNGAFLPNVVTGLVPMEPYLRDLPEVGQPAAEVLVLDTAATDDTTFDVPFGTLVFLTTDGEALGDELRERYGLLLDRRADTRPDIDPY